MTLVESAISPAESFEQRRKPLLALYLHRAPETEESQTVLTGAVIPFFCGLRNSGYAPDPRFPSSLVRRIVYMNRVPLRGGAAAELLERGDSRSRRSGWCIKRTAFKRKTPHYLHVWLHSGKSDRTLWDHDFERREKEHQASWPGDRSTRLANP